MGNLCALLLWFVFAGSKKYTKKTLKTLKQLYSSFPSEVVSILLEFLLKALDSSNYVELPKEYEAGQNPENLLDEWRLVITKLSNEEPEVLLNLLQAILDMVGSHKHMENETGTCQIFFDIISILCSLHFVPDTSK